MMARWLRRLALATAGLGGALALGFAVFVHASLQDRPPPARADGIVALTGGADRIETALRLLATGHADRLLVSGVAPHAFLSDLTERIGMQASDVASRVTLGRAAQTTYGNAEETAEWVHEHTVHDLIVVTAGYHMPRALLELRRALPDVTLHPVAVQPPGIRAPGYARLLLAEYVKFLGAWLGVGGMAPLHGPPDKPAPDRNPVDKSGGARQEHITPHRNWG